MEDGSMSAQLPQVWIGAYGAQAVQQSDDTDVDDEQLAVTPPDVIDALGFDPLEFDGEAKAQIAQASRPKDQKSPPD
jgi:hypothetical protein